MAKDKKRKGPKSTRSGCLMCKPWKHQAEDKRTMQDKRSENACKVDYGRVY